MERTGGRGKCAVCGDDRQAEIDAAMVSGQSYGEVSRRYGISRPALTAHKTNHLNPALVKVQKEKLEKGATSLIDRLERLVERAGSFLDLAESNGNPNQGLAAIRELRATLELLARITGELDERPAVTVNLQMTHEWLEVRAAIFEVLQPHPDVRLAVADRLSLLEAS